MFEITNKIILVDDNPSDLKTLSAKFNEKGIGCKTYEYDDFFPTPIVGIRIAFFDINLKGVSSDAQRNANLENAINQYISIENGPFALIFWTSEISWVEQFTEYINRTGSSSLAIKPFFVDSISKTSNSDEIEEKLKSIFEKKPLQLLFDFENKAKLAAHETIGNIYDFIPKDTKWGETSIFEENFQSTFSKIAISSLGFEKAKENPDKAIIESLMPIHNHFLQNKSDYKWFDYLDNLKKATTFKDIKSPSPLIESKLNSFFHIDTNLPSYCKNIRGCVFQIDDCLIDFQKYFGYTKDECQKFILDIKKSEIIEQCKFVAIEISSVCDYAQNKQRVNKFVMGLKTPRLNNNDYKLTSESTLPMLKHNSFFDGQEEFQVWFNFNKVFTVYENDPILNNPIFIFKKEIVDMIGNRYANHVSRIGITSF